MTPLDPVKIPRAATKTRHSQMNEWVSKIKKKKRNERKEKQSHWAKQARWLSRLTCSRSAGIWPTRCVLCTVNWELEMRREDQGWFLEAGANSDFQSSIGRGAEAVWSIRHSVPQWRAAHDSKLLLSSIWLRFWVLQSLPCVQSVSQFNSPSFLAGNSFCI